MWSYEAPLGDMQFVLEHWLQAPDTWQRTPAFAALDLPLARSQLLPKAMTRVLARHPRLQIRSLESPYEELAAGLMSGRIDFIVGALRAFSSDTFDMRPLVADSAALIAAMTQRYPDAGMGVALQIGAKVATGEMKWG